MSKAAKRRRHRERQRALAAARGNRVLYFAYGSNCNVGQMSRRCPDASLIGTGTLLDWRLTFRGCADVEPHDGSRVEGALWLVSANDLVALDRYEGYPTLYNRGILDVETPTGTVQAITYWMTSEDYEALPSLGYFETCAVGYADCGLDVAQLRRAVKRVADSIAARGRRFVVPRGKHLVPVEVDDILIEEQATLDEDITRWERVDGDVPLDDEDIAAFVRRTGRGTPATRALFALE